MVNNNNNAVEAHDLSERQMTPRKAVNMRQRELEFEQKLANSLSLNAW